MGDGIARTYITSQNHGYAVDAESVRAGRLSFVNANDGTCEGMDYPDLGAFTVQFHPEAHGGPGDTKFLFEKFAALMSGGAYIGGAYVSAAPARSVFDDVSGNAVSASVSGGYGKTASGSVSGGYGEKGGER